MTRVLTRRRAASVRWYRLALVVAVGFLGLVLWTFAMRVREGRADEALISFAGAAGIGAVCLAGVGVVFWFFGRR